MMSRKLVQSIHRICCTPSKFQEVRVNLLTGLLGIITFSFTPRIVALYDYEEILSFYAFCCLFGIIFCGYYFGILMQQVHSTFGNDDIMLTKKILQAYLAFTVLFYPFSIIAGNHFLSCQNLFFIVIKGVDTFEFLYTWRGELELLEDAGKVDCDDYTHLTTDLLEGAGNKDPLDVIE
ncbi:hypothetical protein CAEBREN_10342 [Caenorhabditis brenneri]|uniref:Uncharacterized protein n=1 Tax=Caenorhabditis brenneri TaxID=135651 RepID=G0N826_CAEBE|nr:hypothetical protein CAEBREN_10342 [Caenorhabditis brenneri]